MRKWTPDMKEAYARKTKRELAKRGIVENIVTVAVPKPKKKKILDIIKPKKKKEKVNGRRTNR